MKSEYIDFVLCEYLSDGNFDAVFGGKPLSESDYKDLAASISDFAFKPYGINTAGHYGQRAQILLDLIAEGKGINRHGDEYGGYWYTLHVGRKDAVIQKLIGENQAKSLIALTSERALENALKRIAEEDGLALVEDDDSEAMASDSSEPIPASDRIVTIDDNQRAEAEAPLEEIIKLVEKENAIDGDSDLRRLTLGRLQAGRELLRAGIFSVRSLQLTLIIGLQLLVEKYREMAIGILAAKLLDLLLKQYGIG